MKALPRAFELSVWDRILEHPDLSFICVGDEEGVELLDKRISVVPEPPGFRNRSVSDSLKIVLCLFGPANSLLGLHRSQAS